MEIFWMLVKSSNLIEHWVMTKGSSWHSFGMMTSSNENFSRVTGHLRGEFTGDRWIPRKASDAELWSFFFDLRLNERLSKQSWGWWFETPSRSLWRYCNGIKHNAIPTHWLRSEQNGHHCTDIFQVHILERALVYILSNSAEVCP